MTVARSVSVIVGVGGMGRAIARRIGPGRSIVLADIDPVVLANVADDLRADGYDVTARTVDVTDSSSVDALADVATSAGPVAQVVHTAGVSPAQASAERILEVDLLGVALVLDVFGAVVDDGSAGVVVASMAGHRLSEMDPDDAAALATASPAELLDLPCVRRSAESARTAYWLAKRGNQLRVQAAAVVWGRRGARVNSISPGMVSTAMGRQELDGPQGARMRAAVAGSGARRLGTPDDIAAAAAFLLGPESSYVTGADLLVDGGVTAARVAAGERAAFS